MTMTVDTVREIAKALRRNVDRAALERVINDLLDVSRNKTFRDTVEKLAYELSKP